MAFVQKNVNSSLKIGLDLIDLRERAGLSRLEASRRTKIAESIIKSWEEDAWDQEDLIYAERQLMGYVRFFGGNETYFLQKYRANVRERRVQRQLEDLLPRTKKVQSFDLIVGARIWAILGVILFAALLGIYLYFLASKIAQAPGLEVFEPVEGQRVTQPEIHISGKTQSESTVTINGSTVAVQPDGSFSTDVYIPQGVTSLTIASKRRHGNESTVLRHVIYERAEAPISTSQNLNLTSTTSSSSTR